MRFRGQQKIHPRHPVQERGLQGNCFDHARGNSRAGQEWLDKYDEMTFGGVQMHFYRKPKRFGGFEKRDNKVETRVDSFLCSVQMFKVILNNIENGKTRD
jgi:hypothetical protein